jgi:hypothetical protein
MSCQKSMPCEMRKSKIFFEKHEAKMCSTVAAPTFSRKPSRMENQGEQMPESVQPKKYYQ